DDPVFDAAEDHLHKNRLRTGPPAEDTSVDHRKKRDEYDEDEHAQAEDKKILRPEDHAEDDELALQHIDQEQRFAVHFNERKPEKDQQVDPRKVRTPAVKRAA